MKITISATLTEDEVFILSTMKWYQEEIVSFEDWKELRVSNTQSRADFIRQVYEGMLTWDAVQVFTEYRSAQLKEQQALLEQAVREWVSASITSAIE